MGTVAKQRLRTIAVLGLLLTLVSCSGSSGRGVDVRAMLDRPSDATAAENALGAANGASADAAGPADASGATGAIPGQVRPGGGPSAAATSVVARTGARSTNVPIGRGVTVDSIRIGFMVTVNLQAGFAAVGASGKPPEERAVRQAVIDWVNTRGGIAGRKIVPVWHEFDVTSGTNESQAQAACATLTEDNQVFAVVSSNVNGSDALATCLAAKGVPDIELNLWPFDKAAYDHYRGLLYQPGRIRSDRAYGAWVDRLADAGYFDSGHRLGILRFDAPIFQRLTDQQVKPRLAARGGNLVEEVTVATPHGVSDFGGMSAAFNSAIVRFRQAGVTHVMMVENAAIMPFFFLQQAESQQFRPRYALTSNDLPGTVAGQSPAAQLNRALALGWTPPADVGYGDHPGGNSAWALCNDIMKKAGFDPTGGGFYTQNACDALFFLKQAGDRAPALTADGLRQGTEALGTAYTSPYGLGPTEFGPGRYDGAAAAGILAYDTPCKCFKFTNRSPLR
jgi:ABC-type branched-subunit amino acid transport system substrate-binding protein